MNKLEYLIETRRIIQKDEFGFYNILERLYNNSNIPKKLFWGVATIGTAMLVKSYTDFWKTEKMLLKSEDKLNDIGEILKK